MDCNKGIKRGETGAHAWSGVVLHHLGRKKLQQYSDCNMASTASLSLCNLETFLIEDLLGRHCNSVSRL